VDLMKKLFCGRQSEILVKADYSELVPPIPDPPVVLGTPFTPTKGQQYGRYIPVSANVYHDLDLELYYPESEVFVEGRFQKIKVCPNCRKRKVFIEVIEELQTIVIEPVGPPKDNKFKVKGKVGRGEFKKDFSEDMKPQHIKGTEGTAFFVHSDTKISVEIVKPSFIKFGASGAATVTPGTYYGRFLYVRSKDSVSRVFVEVMQSIRASPAFKDMVKNNQKGRFFNYEPVAGWGIIKQFVEVKYGFDVVDSDKVAGLVGRFVKIQISPEHPERSLFVKINSKDVGFDEVDTKGGAAGNFAQFDVCLGTVPSQPIYYEDIYHRVNRYAHGFDDIKKSNVSRKTLTNILSFCYAGPAISISLRAATSSDSIMYIRAVRYAHSVDRAEKENIDVEFVISLYAP
jgi:hypothetical protein